MSEPVSTRMSSTVSIHGRNGRYQTHMREPQISFARGGLHSSGLPNVGTDIRRANTAVPPHPPGLGQPRSLTAPGRGAESAGPATLRTHRSGTAVRNVMTAQRLHRASLEAVVRSLTEI